MTLGEPSHNGHLSASLPKTTSAAPLQIRFPARSRKSAAQPVATDSDPNEDLQLAPAHQAVLHCSSPNHHSEQAFTVEDQDLDLFDSEDMQAAQQESNFDVTTAAVATSATLADVGLGLGPSPPLSSAGSTAIAICPATCKCSKPIDAYSLMQVQMQRKKMWMQAWRLQHLPAP